MRDERADYTVAELAQHPQTFPRAVAYLPPWERIPESLTRRYCIVNCSGPRGEYVHVEARDARPNVGT